MLKTSLIIEDLDDPKKFRMTLEQIRSAGFDAVDPALFTPGIIRIIESPEGPAYAADLGKMVEDAGLFIGQCHTALCPSPDQWERVIAVTKKTLPFAAKMGARFPVVHPICPLDIEDPLIHASAEEIFERNQNMFGQLVPIAEDLGINILIENLFADGPCRDAVPCWSTYAEELNRLMDAFPGMYICFDSGHAAITGQEPSDMVYQLGDRVKALHLHGNDRIQDLHLTPFETADMGWKLLCTALKDIGYEGTINLEVLSAVRRTPVSVRPALYGYLHACADYFVQLTGSDRTEGTAL